MRIRPFPMAIFAAALMLTVRGGDLLRHLDIGVGQTSEAQAAGGPSAPGGKTPPAAAQPPAPAKPAANQATSAQAPAAAQPAPAAAASAAPSTAPAQQAAGDSQTASLPVDLTDSEIDLLQSLAQRRSELDQRARELDLREGVLKAAEKRVDDKIAKLGEMQSTLQSMLKQFDVKTDDELQNLVKIYENMKPKDAARIWNELDIPVIIQVFTRMNDRKASAILAAMSPDMAKRVTDELIRRRQLPGDVLMKGNG